MFRAGLLPEASKKEPAAPGERTGKANGRTSRTSHRERSLEVIRRFGYLQLDTVSIAGARSHSIVLLSRLPGIGPELGEELLRPGEPIFEYWGHEVSWIPLELFSYFEFRRKEFRKHPWWGNVIAENRKLSREILARIRSEGP
ncbi:MAG TPA: crosslink repair DNA glycosylase YcaQ family protein, partial [bacterium]|nr:crosslink repair DNA glycosylase YcaQ family protein [bacterium]